MDGGESSEAGHVGLGPVQGVEPMSAPHQHPVRDHHQDYQSSNLQDLSASFSPNLTGSSSQWQLFHLSPGLVLHKHTGRRASTGINRHQSAILPSPHSLPSNCLLVLILLLGQQPSLLLLLQTQPHFSHWDRCTSSRFSLPWVTV